MSDSDEELHPFPKKRLIKNPLAEARIYNDAS